MKIISITLHLNMIDLYKFMFLLVCLNFLIINPTFSQIEKELNPPEYINTVSFKTTQ